MIDNVQLQKKASVNFQLKKISVICKGNSNLEYMCYYKDEGYDDNGDYDDEA